MTPGHKESACWLKTSLYEAAKGEPAQLAAYYAYRQASVRVLRAEEKKLRRKNEDDIEKLRVELDGKLAKKRAKFE